MGPERFSALAGVAYYLRHGFWLLWLFGHFVLIGVAILLIIAWLVPTARARALWVTAILLALGLSQPYVDRIAHGMRRRMLPQAVEQLTPLVDAVERYRRERGTLPARLADVSSAYPTEIDKYGLRGCRSLTYDRPDTGGAPWSLQFECPNGLLTLDRLYYTPRPPGTLAAGHERVGTWLYFWD
jgi:hypothetical protein